MRTVCATTGARRDQPLTVLSVEPAGFQARITEVLSGGLSVFNATRRKRGADGWTDGEVLSPMLSRQISTRMKGRAAWREGEASRTAPAVQQPARWQGY